MESTTTTNDYEEPQGPSINSNDPKERKLARRLRIQRRLENAERQKLVSGSKYCPKEPEKSLIEETIETSDDNLIQLCFEGKELVSNIRVASDATEVKRRETEADERKQRLQELTEESVNALEKLNEISSKWEAIVETSGPLELSQHIKDQKAKCLELIEQKNGLIKSFQQELKLADEKFMRGRKTMYQELELLTKRIDEQVLLMKKAYRLELNNIEDSIDVTRNQLIEKHSKIWLALYNQREKDEVVNIGRKFDLIDQFHEEMYRLHVNHEEEYRETRISLETDIQMLEQELEQIKALCLLNSEKLDYNYQVLKKREEENVYIKNHQKRRLNKLQDVVNSLKKKIEEKRQSTEEELKRLIKEVERYHTCVLETEKKADHFSQVNENKFQSIWDMKDEEAKELINTIIMVNTVVHEEILGVNWTPPSNPGMKKTNLPSFKTAKGVVKSMHKSKALNETQTPSEPKMSPEIEFGRKRLMRHILELIADQTGFLMEEKLDKLLSPFEEEEKIFVRLENVFAAIALNTEKELKMLEDIFRPFAICQICDKKDSHASFGNDPLESLYKAAETRQPSILQMRELEEKVSKLRIQAKKEEEDPTTSTEAEQATLSLNTESSNDAAKSISKKSQENTKDIIQNKSYSGKSLKCNLSHPLVIEKHHVLKALKNFVSAFHGDKCGVLTGMATRLSKKRYTISRLLSEQDILSYWETYRELIPSNLNSLWSTVYLALNRYLSILQERHELNIKANKIRRQNLELKRLLKFYTKNKAKNIFHLPAVSSVPDEPIDAEELSRIVVQLSF